MTGGKPWRRDRTGPHHSLYGVNSPVQSVDLYRKHVNNSTCASQKRMTTELQLYVMILTDNDMAYLKRILRSKPSVRPCLPARLLPSTKLVEEEYSPEYSQERFYPMRLYETLNDRYQVVSKLGPGVTSTAWLAKDLHQYMTLPRLYPV